MTLNFQPKKQWQYFCRDEYGEKMVGMHANHKIEINDIEFLSTWKDPKMREAICENLKNIMEPVRQNRRTLFHCEAGRDRTGAVAGLLAALTFEGNGVAFDDQVVAAIECDYTKSKSLAKDKHDRIRNFLREVRSKSGSVSAFVQENCGIQSTDVVDFADRMRAQ